MSAWKRMILFAILKALINNAIHCKSIIRFSNKANSNKVQNTSTQLIKTLHSDCAHFTAARTPLQRAIKSDLRPDRLLFVTSSTL